jgi:glycosyltransferase involved in cell wall biosynthesis
VATAQDIVRFYFIPSQKITPTLLAYDADHFRPMSTGAATSIDKLVDKTAGEMPSYFLYIGRHDPYKNLHRLMAAFAAIAPTCDCQLWFAGSTDARYTPTLQTQARELGIAERVRFLEYVAYDELPVLLNRAIAMVFPSLWEGFGFPILEAMACGTPVITSNLASMPEVAGDAAILIDPYNTAELSAAMQQVVGDAGVRSQLRSAGLVRASQFSWKKTAQETTAILQRYH